MDIQSIGPKLCIVGCIYLGAVELIICSRICSRICGGICGSSTAAGAVS